MRWKWSLAHIERRIDRYHRLAAAAKIPELRRHYIAMARRYWDQWATAIARAAEAHSGRACQTPASPI